MGLMSFLFGGKDEPQEGDTVYIQNPDYGEYDDDREVIPARITSATNEDNADLLNGGYVVNYDTLDPNVTGGTWLERDDMLTEKEVSKPWWALW